jgi:hypothetical protein
MTMSFYTMLRQRSELESNSEAFVSQLAISNGPYKVAQSLSLLES